MRRIRHQASALLLALTLATILLAGCAAPWPVPQPTPDPKLPDSQQIFRPQEIGPASGDLETLDPALIEFQTDYDNAQLLFPALVTLDEHSQPVDWAATSHDVSADGLTYTFHLRTGMTWSDGAPIDATTYAYAINRSEDPCTDSPNANYLDPIKGATALYHETCPTGATHVRDTLIGKSVIASDPQTLTIILAQPAGYFLTALTSATAWAVPQTLVERYTAPSTGPRYPLITSTWTEHLADNGGFGGNLYRLTKWDHTGHVEFERNERFWGQKPLLRRIEYTLYKTTDVAWADFLAGQGDSSQPPLAQLDAAKRMKGATFQQTPQLSTAFLVPNWHILPPFDDLRVRQALFLAIDRTRLAHEVFADTVVPSIHLTPAGMAGYNETLADPAGRRGQDALTADLATARALGTAYAAEKCAGDVAKCEPIVLTIHSVSLNAQRGQIIQQNWREVFPQWPFYVESYDCDAIVCTGTTIQLDARGWLDDYPDPQDFLSLQWSTQSVYNQSFVSIPQVDALCAQADAATDQQLRVSLYQQAEQLLITQVAAIPLYQRTATSVVRSRVVNWRMAPAGMTPLGVWQQVYVQR
jgi:peptide/nickel transport system substrate-binding protein/oligopeptide transport system substrate-binding protein